MWDTPPHCSAPFHSPGVDIFLGSNLVVEISCEVASVGRTIRVAMGIITLRIYGHTDSMIERVFIPITWNKSGALITIIKREQGSGGEGGGREGGRGMGHACTIIMYRQADRCVCVWRQTILTRDRQSV